MNAKRVLVLMAAVVLAALGATQVIASADDQAADAPDPPAAMVAALVRDLRMTEGDVTARLAVEAAAPATEERVRGLLGDAFGGAWLEPDRPDLVVGVVGDAEAEGIRAQGVEPVVVSRSLAELEGVKAALDDQPPADDVYGWYIDLPGNVIAVQAGSAAAVQDLAAAAGVPADVLRFEETGPGVEEADLTGGDALTNPQGARCTLGFAVAGGFVTVGHCLSVGQDPKNAAGVVVGRTRRTSQNPDFALVTAASGATPAPFVHDQADTLIPVLGDRPAPVGASVCHSGFKSGWQCGTILSVSGTWKAGDGSLNNNVATARVCSRPGDSGGPYLWGNDAQGIHLGETRLPGVVTSCVDGTRYIQKIRPVLSAAQATLLIAPAVRN
jgi:streptogrisin C